MVVFMFQKLQVILVLEYLHGNIWSLDNGMNYIISNFENNNLEQFIDNYKLKEILNFYKNQKILQKKIQEKNIKYQ